MTTTRRKPRALDDGITAAQRQRIVELLETVRAGGAEDVLAGATHVGPVADFVAPLVAIIDGAELVCQRCERPLERVGREVAPCACGGVTAEDAVDLLNALTAADRGAMLRLVETRVFCHEDGIPELVAGARAEGPFGEVPPRPGAVLLASLCQVGNVRGWYTLGLPGVLNGLFGGEGRTLVARIERPADGGPGSELRGFEIIDEGAFTEGAAVAYPKPEDADDAAT